MRPIIRKGPANRYASPDEVIVEFSSDHGGGLISLRYIGQRLVVDVHRCDDNVVVLGPGETFDPVTGIKSHPEQEGK
jgi:hypothetical protein